MACRSDSWPSTCASVGSRPARRRGSTAARSTGRSLEMQPGDEPPVPFSFLTGRIANPQIECGVTAHDRGDPRHHPRQPGPLAHVFRPDRQRGAALLPLHRGQGRALRRPGRASDLPGAGGPRRRHGLPQRRLDLAAGGRAGGVPAHDSGPGKGGDSALRLCHRVRLCRPARAAAHAGGQAPAAPVPGRPDQRHHRLRGGRAPRGLPPASMRP